MKRIFNSSFLTAIIMIALLSCEKNDGSDRTSSFTKAGMVNDHVIMTPAAIR